MHSDPERATPVLGVGLTVYTKDGQRLGRIEVVGCDAFKVGAARERPAVWLLHAAAERTTEGGLVFTVPFNQLDDYRWVPPPNPLTADGSAA